MVRGYQREVKRFGRGGEKAIGGIVVLQGQLLCREDNLVRQGRLVHIRRRSGYPFSDVAGKPYSAFGMEQQDLPCADRRNP
jgi:hypothetical protein